MTVFASLVLALPLAVAPAPGPALPPTPPDVAAKMAVLFSRASPAVRSWVDAEARKVRTLPPPDATALATDARRGFPAAQPPLTPGQADTLAAMAAFQVVSDIDSEARLAAPGTASSDAITRLADRKSAFLKTLTGLLRRISDTDAAIVSGLK